MPKPTNELLEKYRLASQDTDVQYKKRAHQEGEMYPLYLSDLLVGSREWHFYKDNPYFLYLNHKKIRK